MPNGGFHVSFQNSPAKGVTANIADPCNSSKKRYQKVEPDWFWVYGVEMNGAEEQMVPKHYIKKPLKKFARKNGHTLVKIEQARRLGYQYQAEAKKLHDMSEQQFRVLGSLTKQLGNDVVQDLRDEASQDSSDDE